MSLFQVELGSVLLLFFVLRFLHLNQRGVGGGIVVHVQFGNLGIDLFQMLMQQAFKCLGLFGHGPA